MRKVGALLGSALGCSGEAAAREGSTAWPELWCLWEREKKRGSHRRPCGSDQECARQGPRLPISTWKRCTAPRPRGQVLPIVFPWEALGLILKNEVSR